MRRLAVRRGRTSGTNGLRSGRARTVRTGEGRGVMRSGQVRWGWMGDVENRTGRGERRRSARTVGLLRSRDVREDDTGYRYRQTQDIGFGQRAWEQTD
jgi:hypothetical protein